MQEIEAVVHQIINIEIIKIVIIIKEISMIQIDIIKDQDQDRDHIKKITIKHNIIKVINTIIHYLNKIKNIINITVNKMIKTTNHLDLNTHAKMIKIIKIIIRKNQCHHKEYRLI